LSCGATAFIVAEGLATIIYALETRSQRWSWLLVATLIGVAHAAHAAY
jgi:uncharacterized membrane protein HdeD (DUF308 family)